MREGMGGCLHITDADGVFLRGENYGLGDLMPDDLVLVSDDPAAGLQPGTFPSLPRLFATACISRTALLTSPRSSKVAGAIFATLSFRKRARCSVECSVQRGLSDLVLGLVLVLLRVRCGVGVGEGDRGYLCFSSFATFRRRAAIVGWRGGGRWKQRDGWRVGWMGLACSGM